jgi:hypothetical protein
MQNIRQQPLFKYNNKAYKNEKMKVKTLNRDLHNITVRYKVDPAVILMLLLPSLALIR